MRWAVLALALTACAGSRITIPATGTRIPFELVMNTPVVRALVGNVELATTFDTGAEPLSLTPEAAARAHLALTSRTFSLNGAASQVGQSSRRTRVTIGPLVLTNVEALVIPTSSTFAELSGTTDDAVLGRPMLGRMLVTIDYPARELRVERGSLPEPNEMDVLSDLSSDALPRLAISVAGTVVTALVDSGCSGTLELPESLASTLPLRAQTEDGGLLRTVDGDRRTRHTKLAGTVTVGGYSIVDPVIDFSTEAILCGKVLREFSITLDSAHRRIRFARPTFDPIALPSERVLGFRVRKREGKWGVFELRRAFAPAGVELNDELVSIDGKSCAELTIDGIYAVVNRATVVHLVLRRAGKLLELDAPIHVL